MSGKTLKFDLDGDNCISVTMSDSGRISLSDIAAATIGNLEDVCWSEPQPGQSPENTDTGVPTTAGSRNSAAETWNVFKSDQDSVNLHAGAVLRPWESESVVRRPDSSYRADSSYIADSSYGADNVLRSQQDISPPHVKPPPSYLEHIQRHYDDSDNDKENQVVKRFKIDQNARSNDLSEQISSFYKNARSNPLSPMSDQFNYPALSNFVTHKPPSPLVKPQPQPKCAGLYQPWSFVSKIPDINFTQPSSSAGSVKSSQQMFMSPSLRFNAGPSQQPQTPLGKARSSFVPGFESPGMDSRMNDSLGLLGSPQMDSPLSKHPYFSDLKALLSSECKRETVPQSLFSMQEKEPSPKNEPESVFSREQKLQERLNKLQQGNPDEVRQMSSVFRYQTALIETERFKTLHECQYPGTYKDSINTHFDNKLHQVMDRVEKSVELLERANNETKAARVAKPRPHLRREAVQLMEEWYSQNLDHPYPTAATVEYLASVGNTGVDQVKKWFANKRNRSQNTRSLTEIAMKKRKLGQLTSS